MHLVDAHSAGATPWHSLRTAATLVGPHSEIFPFAAVGARPQDLKYQGEVSETRMGARCQVHHHAHICGGTAGGGGQTILGLWMPHPPICPSFALALTAGK